MIVFVKKVRKLMITQFGYIHPIKLLYLDLPDTLHHIIRVGALPDCGHPFPSAGHSYLKILICNQDINSE